MCSSDLGVVPVVAVDEDAIVYVKESDAFVLKTESGARADRSLPALILSHLSELDRVFVTQLFREYTSGQDPTPSSPVPLTRMALL